MPVFVGYFKATLENIGSLEPKADNTWKIDVQNSQSEEKREGVTINAEEEVELEGSRGTANLEIRFPDSTEKANCSIIGAASFQATFKKNKAKLKEMPRAVTAEDSDEWVPIVAFEARGLDVVKLTLGVDDFTAKSSGGGLLEEVDLSDDFADYDEPNELSIGITSSDGCNLPGQPVR